MEFDKENAPAENEWIFWERNPDLAAIAFEHEADAEGIVLFPRETGEEPFRLDLSEALARLRQRRENDRKLDEEIADLRRQTKAFDQTFDERNAKAATETLPFSASGPQGLFSEGEHLSTRRAGDAKNRGITHKEGPTRSISNPLNTLITQAPVEYREIKPPARSGWWVRPIKAVSKFLGVSRKRKDESSASFNSPSFGPLDSLSTTKIKPIDIKAYIENLEGYHRDLRKLIDDDMHPATYIKTTRKAGEPFRGEDFIDDVIAMKSAQAESARRAENPAFEANMFRFVDHRDFVRTLDQLQMERQRSESREPLLLQAFVSVNGRDHALYYDVVMEYDAKLGGDKISIVGIESTSNKNARNVLKELTSAWDDHPDTFHNESVVATNMQKSELGCDIYSIAGLFTNSNPEYRGGVNALHATQLTSDGLKPRLIVDSLGSLLHWKNYSFAQSLGSVDVSHWQP